MHGYLKHLVVVLLATWSAAALPPCSTSTQAKVIPPDLSFAHHYQEVAKDFQQLFKPHTGGR